MTLSRGSLEKRFCLDREGKVDHFQEAYASVRPTLSITSKVHAVCQHVPYSTTAWRLGGDLVCLVSRLSNRRRATLEICSHHFTKSVENPHYERRYPQPMMECCSSVIGRFCIKNYELLQNLEFQDGCSTSTLTRGNRRELSDCGDDFSFTPNQNTKNVVNWKVIVQLVSQVKWCVKNSLRGFFFGGILANEGQSKSA